jgi:aspartate beta-hydroxylase
MWSLPTAARDRLWRDVTELLGRAGLSRIEGMLELLVEGRAGFHDAGAQKVRSLWLPELPSRPWFEADALPWVAALESLAPAIAFELGALEADPRAFGPYLDAPEEQANPHATKSGLRPPERGWKAFFFCRDGRFSPRALAACPRTAGALELAPLAHGDVMLSRLDPRTEIPPHHGLDNLALTCHLGLRVPAGCELQVGAERRAWEEGRCLVFDDTYLHAAWNRSDAARVVLLFDFWHPDLRRVELSALRFLLPEIKRHNPPGRAEAGDE